MKGLGKLWDLLAYTAPPLTDVQEGAGPGPKCQTLKKDKFIWKGWFVVP